MLCSDMLYKDLDFVDNVFPLSSRLKCPLFMTPEELFLDHFCECREGIHSALKVIKDKRPTFWAQNWALVIEPVKNHFIVSEIFFLKET